jgi:hypothetical protein
MNDDTSPTDVSAIAPTLEQVRQRFESWRQRRKKRTRIPQSLWQAAIALSEEYSICHLSKTLRVNYTALKNKVENADSPEEQSSDILPTPFIRLPTPTVPLLESTIEMIKSDGSVMRMNVKGAGCSDWVELAKAFLASDL